jgi:hypothetical protein
LLKKKEPKRLFYSGPWALAATKPKTQFQESFCAAFFKKRLLA